MMALGFEPSDDEIDKMVSSIDTDGNSQLEFSEFMEMMNGKMVTPRNSHLYSRMSKYRSASIDYTRNARLIVSPSLLWSCVALRVCSSQKFSCPTTKIRQR